MWAGLVMIPLFVVMLELTPLILLDRGPIGSLLGSIAGLNGGLATLSSIGGLVASRRPPKG